MSDKDGLRTYRGKRRFDRTSEPSGERPVPDEAGSAGDDEPTFVVQIHDASTMHFDFRLEVDGVLKSWSVPKGPSTDPHDKRLALPTEDHPLEYRDFEGVIPQGEYGGGTVIVWDRGTYRPTSHDKRNRPVPFGQALENGHATFVLRGEKLRGQYALTRFHGREEKSGGSAGKPTWLLVRTGHGSAGGGTPDPRRARSARSGRTLRQVAQAPDAPVWEPDDGERR
ncbi:DNA polymerase ligase N-terminal domain-containing protein [Streptomyces aurantiacus]|uniref:Putative DNA ligase-like protein n=1 Tax=Streptomyces aurantiacus JA 4570 TaxID=1286094 RepID=S3ZF91_9ACTN|nr:DNA polymerase ligase N-terminal domain-containing protein [Streptomyces aurantiacus]EPH41823.1 putative DNA ligase-like protein [Streptomyces aurantiacus JA 4570]